VSRVSFGRWFWALELVLYSVQSIEVPLYTAKMMLGKLLTAQGQQVRHHCPHGVIKLEDALIGGIYLGEEDGMLHKNTDLYGLPTWLD